MRRTAGAAVDDGRAAQPGQPVARKEGWIVRSIEPEDLPAVCRYCRPRPRQPQAQAMIACRIVDVYPSGAEIVRSERKAPVCVDHGVYVQQRYIIPELAGA